MGARASVVAGVVGRPVAWAVLGCALAIGSTFLVWDRVPILGLGLPVTGFKLWFGKGIAGVFLALGLLLLATARAGRPPAWQPAAVGLAGAALLAFAVLYQSDAGGHRETAETTTMTVGGVTTEAVRPIRVDPGEGLYAVQGVGVLLLVVAVLLGRQRRTGAAPT